MVINRRTTDHGPWPMAYRLISPIPQSLDFQCDALRELERAQSIGAGDTRLTAFLDRRDEIRQLPLQRLFVCHLDLAAVDRRHGTVAANQAPALNFLRRVVYRQIGV